MTALKIKKVQGFKGRTPEQRERDRIIVLECDGCQKHHAMEYPQIAEFLYEICHVEDNLYPPEVGLDGAQRFITYLNDAMKTRKIPDRKKYGFKK